MIRVLHVINQLGPGGAESLLMDLADAGPAAGFTCEMLGLYASIPGFREAGVAKGYRMADLGGRLNGVVRPTLGLLRHIARSKPDIVHIHLPQAEVLAAALRPLFPRTPFVCTIHNTFDEKRGVLWRPVRVASQSAFDAIVSCGEVVGAAQTAFMPRLAPRHRVIRNGARIPAYDGARLPEDLPAEYLLFLGNVKPQKAADLLVRAVAAAKNPLPVLMVGGVVGDPGQGDALSDLVASLGLGDRVRWLGRQPRDVSMALLKGARAMLLPSRWEGMPITVIEALLLGTPVVATPVGEVPYMIEDGVSGLVVPVGDVEALAAAIDRVSTDDALVAQLRAGAAARGPEFEIGRTAAAYGELYRELLRAR